MMKARIEDYIDEMVKQQPQVVDGKIVWVFTGGLSVYLLMNYHKDRIDKCLKMVRDIKDIDIYSFSKNIFTHEKYLTNIIVSIGGCDSRVIDSCINFHFEFIQPTITEIVEVYIMGTPIYTVSPEYLLCFKCFSIMKFRESDYVDSIKIMENLPINPSKLIEIIDRTPYSHLFHRNEKTIIDDIKSKKVYDTIKNNIYDKYIDKRLSINLSDIEYAYISSVINFYNEIDLNDSKIELVLKNYRDLMYLEANDNLKKLTLYLFLIKEKNHDIIYIKKAIEAVRNKTIEIEGKFVFETFFTILVMLAKYPPRSKRKIGKILERGYVYSSIIKYSTETFEVFNVRKSFSRPINKSLQVLASGKSNFDLVLS